MHNLAPGDRAALAACRIPKEYQHTGLNRIKTWSRNDGIVYGKAEKREFARGICPRNLPEEFARLSNEMSANGGICCV